jgi:hypothetical protein
MQWIKAWAQAFFGPPLTDPWEDDPQIKTERAGQHDRINAATRFDLERQQRERRIRAIEESWRRQHDD